MGAQEQGFKGECSFGKLGEQLASLTDVRECMGDSPSGGEKDFKGGQRSDHCRWENPAKRKGRREWPNSAEVSCIRATLKLCSLLSGQKVPRTALFYVLQCLAHTQGQLNQRLSKTVGWLSTSSRVCSVRAP